MLRPKKNSYKEFDNEKKFLRLKNSPPPPITFLMVRPLIQIQEDKSALKLFDQQAVQPSRSKHFLSKPT